VTEDLHNVFDKKLIVGIGSALVDILALEEEEFINRSGAAKGGMILVSNDVIESTLSQTTKKPSFVPGGSHAIRLLE